MPRTCPAAALRASAAAVRAFATARNIAAALAVAMVALAPLPVKAQSGAFGHAVVIGDGEILIAEPTTNFRPGAVYVYRGSGTDWSEAGIIRAPDADVADGFGTLLAGTGSTLFVGQRGGPLHVFERNDGGEWLAASTIDDPDIAGLAPGCRFDGYCGTDFGLSLAADGDWLMVGAYGAEAGNGPRTREAAPRGVVHTYQRDASGAWVRRDELRPDDGQSGDRFGAAMTFAADGLLVGAPGWDGPGGNQEDAGRVYHFRMTEGQWVQSGVLESPEEANANFGSALAAAGSRVLVGAPGLDDSRGAVYGHTWDERQARWASSRGPIERAGGEEGDRFGAAVAIAGNSVWVGAPTTRGYETGSVFVYGGDAAGPREVRLPSDQTVESDRFGGLVVAGGGVVAVGAPGMHHQAGSVHLFAQSGGQWEDAGFLVSEPDFMAPMVGEELRCSEEGRAGPFDCEDVELLAYVPPSLLRAEGSERGVRANDNWGWTDPQTGREYALVGRNDGTSFIDVTDPTNPVLVGDLPKTPNTPPSQLWRDIKTYRDHAYIVADGAGEHGMQVFDLARLRDVSPGDMPALFEPDAHYTEIASSHNIVINEETGFAYAVGSGAGGESCGGGLHMINISDPKNPTFAGCGSSDGIHDSQCVTYRGPDSRYSGRELCLNSNGQVFEIVDVTDKDNPVQIGTGSSPNPAYIHQGWLTEDHRYFFQDDESDVIAGNVETTRTLIWDLIDLEDPLLVNEFMGSHPASAHNLYIKGDLMFQANYLYGLHVLDISDPENPREIASFDTAPGKDGPGFGGAWSNYPYFESGTVIVTSMQEGLFVLRRRVRPVS